MDSRHGKMRMNVEGDRLSSLPDDVIHKILSFMDMREAIGTSGLSSRWRFIWTSMPYLNFSTEDFSTLPKFYKFATRVLIRRNDLTYVYSMKLSIHVKVSLGFVKIILNYAFLHSIQQLSVTCLLENGIGFEFGFPLSLFSSESLKHLSLKMQISRSRMYAGGYSSLTSTWELPTLTTLDLHYVILCDDEADKCVGIFLKCANLQNLRLNRFKTKGSDGFSIVHPRLSNLTLEYGCTSVKLVNVAAPQLQNLTIRFGYAECVITAPNLASFLYKGDDPLHLSTDGFHSLDKADICVARPKYADVHQIICLLQQFHNVHFLTLNLEIIEILSLSKNIILHQPSPFVNLRKLKIYPDSVYSWYPPDKKVNKLTMCTELKSYFLDSSPRSTFTMVLREEVKAQEIMAELGVILEKEKDNTKTNRAHLERGKAHVDESHRPKKLKAGGDMAPMKSRWKNLGVQVEKARLIVSKLQSIEELVKELPASNMAKIQPCFSSLCAEADIAISIIADCMKIQCDKNQSNSTVSFHELATTLDPSS